MLRTCTSKGEGLPTPFFIFSLPIWTRAHRNGGDPGGVEMQCDRFEWLALRAVIGRQLVTEMCAATECHEMATQHTREICGRGEWWR